MATTAAALHILVKHKEQADDILKQLKKKGLNSRPLPRNTQRVRRESAAEISVSSVKVRWSLHSTKQSLRGRCWNLLAR